MNWFGANKPEASPFTPEERRAALAKLSAVSEPRIPEIENLEQFDVSELSYDAPEPVKLVGIEADGYRNATQAMLDAATERDKEIATAIEKNRIDAQNENTRLNEERAKNKKIIESTLAALSVFATPEPQMPRAMAPEHMPGASQVGVAPPMPRSLRVKLPRNADTPIVIYGPQASGKTRHIGHILDELNRRGCKVVDDWNDGILPSGAVATTTVRPDEFESSDRKTDYCWIPIEKFHAFPWWKHSNQNGL